MLKYGPIKADQGFKIVDQSRLVVVLVTPHLTIMASACSSTHFFETDMEKEEDHK
jgi:hypothetical protein